MRSVSGIGRRAFLGYAGLGLSAALPRWLREGFRGPEQGAGQEQRVDPPSLADVLRERLEHARTLGKPLLVLVVPRVREQIWERQDIFGQYLNLCLPEALADLALCELACASREDLDLLALELEPDAPQEPLLVLVETDRASFAARSLDPELPEVARGVPWGEGEEARWEETCRARIERLAAALHGVLAGDLATLERRARQVRNTLDAGTLQRAALLIEAPASAAPEHLDRVAALLALSAANRPELRAGCLEALAAAARARLRLVPPPGAWWASYTGCGADIEGQPETGIIVGCGMARVPDLGRRFLHFYSTPRWM
jgi:hypothetical protein